MQNEELLGYSAREMWLDPWPEPRRAASLFRLDVQKALSVDVLVWPSVFDADPSLDTPPWMGHIQDLWDSRTRLEQELDRQWRGRWKASWIIAGTLRADLCSPAHRAEWATRIGPVEPPLDRSGATLLGYDVADFWLMSGLSDMVFQPAEDAEALQRRWGGELNEFHLFRSAAGAREFIPLANERSPEHAPFFVFGVWLVKKVHA